MQISFISYILKWYVQIQKYVFLRILLTVSLPASRDALLEFPRNDDCLGEQFDMSTMPQVDAFSFWCDWLPQPCLVFDVILAQDV